MDMEKQTEGNSTVGLLESYWIPEPRGLAPVFDNQKIAIQISDTLLSRNGGESTSYSNQSQGLRRVGKGSDWLRGISLLHIDVSLGLLELLSL
jgi:hypothetical protein